MLNQELALSEVPGPVIEGSLASPLPSADSVFGSAFTVHLGFFEGPLDLLLHLVRRAEVPIAEVEMALIAEQYLEIVEHAAQLDIEIATEFIVVAATLLALKSEALLPGAGSLGSDEGYEDPTLFSEELRERLRKYEQTKLQAVALNSSPQLGVDTFSRFDRDLYRVPQQVITEESDLQLLPMLFVKLLKRIGERVDSMRIRLEPISVVDFMMKVVDTLQGVFQTTRQSAAEIPKTFRALISQLRQRSSGAVGAASGLPPQSEASAVIGGFIALLELVKRGVVGVSQESDHGEIELVLRMHGAENLEGADLAGIEAEYDSSQAPDEYSPDNVVEFPRREGSEVAPGAAGGEDTDNFSDERREVNRE